MASGDSSPCLKEELPRNKGQRCKLDTGQFPMEDEDSVLGPRSFSSLTSLRCSVDMGALCGTNTCSKHQI